VLNALPEAAGDSVVYAGRGPAGAGGEGARAAGGGEAGLLRGARRLPRLQVLPRCACSVGATCRKSSARLLVSLALAGSNSVSTASASPLWHCEALVRSPSLRSARHVAEPQAPVLQGLETKTDRAKEQCMQKGLQYAVTPQAKSKLVCC
jgi:hypothetical protein